MDNTQENSTVRWDEIVYNPNTDKWELWKDGKLIYSAYSFFYVASYAGMIDKE